MSHQFGWSQRVGLGLGLVLLSLGLWLNWICSPNSIRSEAIRVSRNPEQTLTGRLYIPQQTSAPYPTVMVWHGVSCTKETMELLAIELARQGIAALAFDAGGFGESYDRTFSDTENLADAKAIATYVFNHPDQFDQTRVGVGGHSMGGATALALAHDDSRIKTAIVLGMSADINRLLPPNLFMGIGLYEQFHTPQIMRAMLQQGTGQPPQDSQLYGDFLKGTARKLVISPTSDHLIEPFDPTLIREAVAWARQVFAVKTPALSLIAPGYILSQFLILVGSILSSGYFLRDAAFARKYRRQVGLSLFVGGSLILILGMGGQLPGPLATECVLLTAVLLPISHYALYYPARLTALVRITGLYAGLIILAYTVLAIMFRGNELITHPAWILGLPQFMLHMPVALIYSRMQEVRAGLFPIYSNGVVPGWGLIFLVLPELMKPGIVLDTVARLAVWLARWLQQPLQVSRWQERPSGKSLKLLGGLVLLLLAILYLQMQGGAFSLDYAWSAMKLQFQMVLLPAMLMIGLMRSPFLQTIEKRCWKA